MYTKYQAIKWDGLVSLLAPSEKTPGLLHWVGGVAHCYMTPRMTVIKEYNGADFEDEEAVELQFRHDFRTVHPEPITETGWIAPDGKFYACEYGEHDGISTDITATLYNDLAGTELLETKGWLRLQEGGIITWGKYTATQPQIDALYDLLSSDNLKPEHKRDCEDSLYLLLKAA